MEKWKKLLGKNILQDTQTLQLSTININRFFYKIIKNAKLKGLG
jgi:hypothetical protein